MDNSNVSFAAGRVIVPIPECPTDYERDASGLARAPFVTANAFCRRDALDAVGGFDERFTMAWREDSDLQFRLLKFSDGPDDPAETPRFPDAVVVHPVRPAHWGVSLMQQRKSQFNALLFKKHPKLYRACIQSSPPWRYYFSVAALSVAIAAFATGVPIAGWAALSLWVVEAIRFTGERLAGTRRDLSHVAEMAVTSALIPLLSIYWRLRGAFRFRVVFV
jgi:hypothetical protein